MLKVDHDRCTECRMCYIVCRELDINAVYVAHKSVHRIEIDPDLCTYPAAPRASCTAPPPARSSSWKAAIHGAAATGSVEKLMHALLEEFLDKWVWPTMPGAPGAEFRLLRSPGRKCPQGVGIELARTLGDIEEELKTNDDPWKKAHALRGLRCRGRA